MEEVLSYSLSYGDELWHVVLYQWLIDNALTDRLLEVRFVFSYYPFVINPYKDDFPLGLVNRHSTSKSSFQDYPHLAGSEINFFLREPIGS